MIKQKVDEQLGPDATFEQRRDLEAELMRDVLWQREDDDLRESVSEADVVEVGGRRYARLSRRSSATYSKVRAIEAMNTSRCWVSVALA
ncbi:hypothetical protein G6O69_19070 [Pseudenhygromyxa sp. WMMC2535]|uniref:hypothetical protein n=1 Tax=Pseudenhygromyxa sp. WMMC2535 TaxID=2712867 RepID=UPI0015518E6F|nr:hypothetical protein [Pseudenhygromyxa sp. WMMC2535]NVB39954.1 hypothetical protein [Pseudenhygromyxa sp. WMMC2535]